ncbi:hypothetical protein [Puniceibacterium confluentis]|uniref:hypothetical protein n=1 Tax=Puniceibacterium confluentis TaxID=1958944 RepID=UPI0035675A9C
MTARTPNRPVNLTVIPGGRSTASRSAAAVLPRPRRPVFGSEALACEMGRIYALTLLRDIPFAWLSDPRHAIRIDAATCFTLHDLQTELRQLPWSSHHASLPSGASPLADILSLCVPGDADHCASSPVPRSGQPLFPATAVSASDPVLSAFFRAGPPRAAGPAGPGLSVPGVADPGADQPMSHWVRWIEAACGARLAWPRRADAARQVLRTPRDLATQVHCRHPCQPYMSAALLLLAKGMPLGADLPEIRNGVQWNAPRVLTMLVSGARQAAQHSRRGDRGPRVARPGVVAARWSLIRSGEDQRAGPEAALEQAALNRVMSDAPRLADWMAAMNRATGTGCNDRPSPDGENSDGWTPFSMQQNLMLPPLASPTGWLCPSVGAGQAVLAGTLVTLLKALFDAPVTGWSDPAPADLYRELDKLALNVTLARSIAGGFYTLENRQSLRFGQSLALILLRDVLEEDGQPGRIDLCDFDNRQVTLLARRSAPGSVRVSLRIDGAYAPWPDSGERSAPYLTAVV